MWKVTSVHQNKSKIFEAILPSSRNIRGYQVCQAEPGLDDRRLQTHSFTLKQITKGQNNCWIHLVFKLSSGKWTLSFLCKKSKKMSPSSQSLSAFQPPLLNTNILTCQLQNVRRIYRGTAGRKSKWQGRDERAKCSKGGAGEHLQGSDFSWGHGLFVAVGHGKGWGTSIGASIRSASECCPQPGYQENCKTHLPRKWRRNISGFGTTSHFCTQKSCQKSKKTTDPKYKHNSYQFIISKILWLESSSRWNYHDQAT